MEEKEIKAGEAEQASEEDSLAKENAEKAQSFEIIESDYERLKGLAERKGVDVGAMISIIEQADLEERRRALSDSCSDPELIDHVLELEAQAKCGGRSDIAEVTALFPEIKGVSALPPEVVKASKLRGSTLLDEYLRHRIKERRAKEAQILAEKQAEKNSIGSQRNAAAASLDPSAAEFIKALWGR